jgi:hypothetical protein
MKDKSKELLTDVLVALAYTIKSQAVDLIMGLILNPASKAVAQALGAGSLGGGQRLLSARTLAMATEDGMFIDGPVSTGYAKFAIRKGMPKPGQKRMAVENEPHTVDDFDGKIEAGYGKGTKKLLWSGNGVVKVNGQSRIGKINIHEHQADRAGLHYDFVAEGVLAGTEKFEVNIPAGPFKGRYVFIQPDGFEKGHVIVSRMNDKGIRMPKPTYTLRNEDIFAKVDPDAVIAERKIDGSLGNAHILEDGRVAFRSHREGGETYHDLLPAIEFIGNQSRLFTNRLLFPAPDLKGTVLQGELYHPEGSSRVSGILNSMPDKALATQIAHGPVKYYVWDILKWKGKDVSKLPYGERRQLAADVVEEIRRYNSNWGLIEARAGSETIEEFYNRVIEDPLPQGEGIVIKPINAVDQKWDKLKVTGFAYFKVKEILPGTGKYADSMGKMVVVNPENGAVGEVGSFSTTDEFRQWIFDHKDLFTDSTAKIRVQEVSARGVPRAGVFLGFHNAEDKLSLYTDSLAGSDEARAKEMLYQFKSSAGWRRS